MCDKKKVYWTTAKGQVLDVDDMDEAHLRNVLKLVLRRIEEAISSENEIRERERKMLKNDRKWME